MTTTETTPTELLNLRVSLFDALSEDYPGRPQDCAAAVTRLLAVIAPSVAASATTTTTEPAWGEEQHSETMLATWKTLTKRQREVLCMCAVGSGVWPGKMGEQGVSRQTIRALYDRGLIAWVAFGYKPTEMGRRVLDARFSVER